jgi:DNA-binding NarL/FixJ family response regulator
MLIPIRILIVEDHPIFAEGLNMILSGQSDMSVVGLACTAREAVQKVCSDRPNITLMDQRLPDGTGTDALLRIRASCSSARVIMLTTFDGDIVIRRALQSGANAYLLKSAPKSELLKTIRSVHQGGTHVSSKIAERLAEHLIEETLTPREIDVLKLTRDGLRNKEIAHELDIAETTVNFHIKNLVSKLRANDRTHAAAIALRRGILEV